MFRIILRVFFIRIKGNVTLGALGLSLGKTTVMHLVPRDNLPEPNSQGKFTFNFNLRQNATYFSF